jgi:hypothetical protein
MIFSSLALAETISRSTEDQLKQIEQRAAKASESKVGEFAKDGVDAAKTSISAAKTLAVAGKEKETLLKIDLADSQLGAAEAKADEKETIEKLALNRAELKKLEVQLERYRQGEAN